MANACIGGSRRVVVTGLGVVSSLGIGWQEFWPNIMAGKSGISRVEAFDTSAYDRHYAGEVKNFDPAKFMNPRKAARIGRASQMAIAASKLAIADAKLELKAIKGKIGVVCIGTTTGEIGLLEKFNNCHIGNSKKEFSLNNISVFPVNALSSNIAVELGISGYNSVFTTACASGNYALAEVFDLIRNGRADFALAGGVDGFSRIVFTGFGRLFAVAPQKCQPFDKNRKGIITGEGCGMLLLESYEHAKKRNAKIYAEILGFGMSCDAKHMTIPSIEGISQAVKKCLVSAGVSASDIDYINAHGTGTRENDEAECKAARNIFGNQLDQIPMSSIKSMIGHTMGAASALESIACCLAIKYQEVPPTINFEEKDPECDIDCVPNIGKKHEVEVVLNSSQAFGGNNACVILRKE